jgi:hypothetical protein
VTPGTGPGESRVVRTKQDDVILTASEASAAEAAAALGDRNRTRLETA